MQTALAECLLIEIVEKEERERGKRKKINRQKQRLRKKIEKHTTNRYTQCINIIIKLCKQKGTETVMHTVKRKCY